MPEFEGAGLAGEVYDSLENLRLVAGSPKSQLIYLFACTNKIRGNRVFVSLFHGAMPAVVLYNLNICLLRTRTRWPNG